MLLGRIVKSHEVKKYFRVNQLPSKDVPFFIAEVDRKKCLEQTARGDIRALRHVEATLQ
jgi:hypothetical protein